MSEISKKIFIRFVSATCKYVDTLGDEKSNKKNFCTN